MAVDIGDLIESLKREVSAPGSEETTFPNAEDDSWFGNLTDCFWQVKLDGLLGGYTMDADGLITPIAPGGPEISGDWQQMIVIYAGIRIVMNQIRAINTGFRAKAGPVEFEVTQSASSMNALLDALQKKWDTILVRLGDLGEMPSYYIDSLIEREIGMYYGDFAWVSQQAYGNATYMIG